MILGFDIGNTSTTVGMYETGNVIPFATYRYPTAKSTDHRGLAGQVIDGMNHHSGGSGRTAVSGMAFSSVVPEVNRAYHEMAKSVFSLTAFEITCRCKLNFTIRYDDPEQLGADRIVNAAAAFAEYGGGTIVVDAGTAVTFCVLLEGGIFDGGIIAPGATTAIESLARRASRLPDVLFEMPDRLVARDTVNALKSGFFYGWLSLVDGIIARIENEYGITFRVILTGGYAGPVAEHLSHENLLDPILAMKGIKIVYDMNR